MDLTVNTPVVTATDVLIDGTPIHRLTMPRYGPLMVEHPALPYGRPVSLLDLQYQHAGQVLPPYQHVVPSRWQQGRAIWKRGYLRYYDYLEGPELFEVLPDEAIHSEYLRLIRGGRPGTTDHGREKAFTLVAARSIKDAYWKGSVPIRTLADRFRVAYQTVFRIVHAETYWYV